jgi:hypothetical protein
MIIHFPIFGIISQFFGKSVAILYASGYVPAMRVLDISVFCGEVRI